MMIAERMLKLRVSTGDATIPVRIFAPSLDKNAWACRWEIHWPGRVRAGDALGFDGVQALVHALQTVGMEIYASDEHRSGQLTWVDDRAGYGFPVPPDMRDALTADDAGYL
jgi:hypothetical protein